MFRKLRRYPRLMTPEVIRLSRPEPRPAPRRPLEGWAIDSGEDVRFAYAATPLPESISGRQLEDPKKVEGARLCAGAILRAEVELPTTPFPEADAEPPAEQ